jgi:hypothetical protein
MRTLDVDWTVDERGGVSLVQVRLENCTETRRRVRVSNRIAGELLPPRRDGVPEAGWDDDGYEGTLAAGESLPLGYACLGDPIRPPIEVSDEGRADDPEAEQSVDAVVRELGSSAPPAAAVPVHDPAIPIPDDLYGESFPADASAVPDPDAEADADGGDLRNGADPDGDLEFDADGDRESGHDPSRSDGAGGRDRGVDAWLDGAERRIERCERLTGATVPEAADVLHEIGGLDGATTLSERVTEDARTLRAIADRASRLAARAEDTDVPIEALRRLA